MSDEQNTKPAAATDPRGRLHAIVGRAEFIQRRLAEFAATAGFLDANHLRKAGDELTELEASPCDPYEMADVVLALMLHAEKHGVDLLTACRMKLAIVEGRQYGEPDERGVVRHVAPNYYSTSHPTPNTTQE